jgi:soluble lytic murein transglycosylase
MQILPSVVQQYAPRLGLPVDLDRAKNDGAYNTKIGTAYLSDLANKFGGSGAGLMLAAAAYHDGLGGVDGYKDAGGVYHPGLIQTYGDPRSGQITPEAWLKAVEARAPKTAGYVRAVVPVAAMRLMGKI